MCFRNECDRPSSTEIEAIIFTLFSHKILLFTVGISQYAVTSQKCFMNPYWLNRENLAVLLCLHLSVHLFVWSFTTTKVYPPYSFACSISLSGLQIMHRLWNVKAFIPDCLSKIGYYIFGVNFKRQSFWRFITKTCLFKYIENFTTKKGKFSDKKILIFFIFLLKT